MSIKNITFVNYLIPYSNGIHVFTDTSYKILYFFDQIEILHFLETLENNKTYVVSIQLINISMTDLLEDS